MDYSKLSDSTLMNLISINHQESNGAGPNSTIQNASSGASGNMQVTGPTSKDPGYGVKPSNGTPGDTSREGAEYYQAMQDKYKDPVLAAMAYNWGPGNMDKWIKGGMDYSKVPDETLKYALNQHTANQAIPQATPAGAPQGFGGSTPPNNDSKTRGLQAIQAMQPDLTQIGPAVTGTGETMAGMLSGTFGQAAGLLHGAADLATGSSYPEAKQDFQKETNAVTYQPKTPEGQQISQNLGGIMDKYLVQPMRSGAQAAMGALPFVGDDLAKSPLANEIAGDVGEGVANIAPMLLGGHEVAKIPGRGMPVKDVGATSELDKLNALYGNDKPPMTPEEQPGGQMDMFGHQDPTGMASPIEPNQLSSDVQSPFVRDKNLRQQSLDFTNGELETPDLLQTRENGDTGTPSQIRDTQLPMDEMSKRVAEFNKAPPEQLDMFSPHEETNDNLAGNDARALSQDEFQQTVAGLAAKDGARFPMPEDMDDAYGKYLDTVKDDQGGLFDRPTIAENFTKMALDEAVDRRIADHPVVKANQARLDQLESQVNPKLPGSQRLVDEARSTLQKSQDNIRKFFEPAAKAEAPFYAKDGQVNMYTFGHLPTLARSIGAILKGLHGIVFKTLDRALPSFKNFDGKGKIFGQAVKDAVNKQANKKWDTQANEGPKKVLKGVPGLREGLKDYLPFESQDLSDADLKTAMQQAPDLNGNTVKGFLRDQFLTGQQLQAFTHHPLVKFATETVDRAMRNSQQFVRERLMGKDGLRDSVRKLSDDEFGTVWHMMQENEGVREFTPQQLKNAGFSDRQIDVYTKMRDLDKQNLENLNRGRQQAGLKPIDARVAHIAGHFLGDFKTVITDSEGKVRAVVAHNLKAGVNVIAKRVLEQLGDGFKMGPIEMRKMSEGNHTDRYTGYMNILNDMSSRDPVVAKVMEAYKDYLTRDAATAMKYRAAFKQKEGVIGAEGRKSWLSQKANAQEGMKNFLKAQEAMNTWANMEEALGKISKFQADPEIDAPNAKASVQKYIDNVQHRNQGTISDGVNGAINAVASVTGIGPSVLKGMSSGIKTGLLTWFIGLGKMSHSFVTLMQPLQGIPVVNSMMRAEGAKLGLTQLTSALKSMVSQPDLIKMIGQKNLPDTFEGRAMKFARDNDTLNTTQFKFGNLTDINRSRTSSNLHTAAEFNVTGMEAGTRSFTFMYYAHMLKDLGLGEKEAFSTAHNAMRDVMVDYNSWERPGVFGKIGFLGDLSAMLTRYKFNQIDQFARAGKYLSKGQIGPMMTVMSTAALFAGARGLMAYTLANTAVQKISQWMAEDNIIKKPTSLDEMLLHMLHGTSEGFSNMVKFGVPSGLGLNMTGSLSHADDIPNDPIGALIPQVDPLGEYAQGAGKFLHDPNKQTAKNMAYQLSPNSLRGPLENLMFTDPNGDYHNPQNNELVTQRSEADKTKRAFGFRPVHEANEKLTTDIAQEQGKGEAAVRQDVTEKLLSNLDSNGKVSSADWNSYVQKYVANNGDPRELIDAAVKHQGIDQKLTNAQRAQGIPKGSLQGTMNYQRYQELK